MSGHLVAASYCVDAASGVLESGYFADVVVVGGDYYELRDVVAGLNVLFGVAGVMQADFDLAAKTLVNDAGAVAEYEVPFDSGAAAYKQHSYMAFWYGHMDSRVPHTMRPHGDCEVVFQGEVHAGITLISKPRLMRVLIK